MSFIVNPYVFGAAGLTSIVRQAVAVAANSETIDLPADIIAGDLLILNDMALDDGAEPVGNTPSGWSTFFAVGGDVNASGFMNRMQVSYKIATGTEGGTTITGMDVHEESDKLVQVFRGNVPFTGATATLSGSTNTNANPVAVSVNADAETPPLIVFGFYGSPSGPISPRTFSPAKDGEDNSANNQLWTAWKIYLSAPADHSIDMDDEGNLNLLAGGVIELTV